MCLYPEWDEEQEFTVNDRLAAVLGANLFGTFPPLVPHANFYTPRPPKFDPGQPVKVSFGGTAHHHTGKNSAPIVHYFNGGRQQGKSSLAIFVTKVEEAFAGVAEVIDDFVGKVYAVFDGAYPETLEALQDLAEVLKPPPPPRHGPPVLHSQQAGCRDAAGTFPTIRVKMCDARTTPDKVIDVTLHKPP